MKRNWFWIVGIVVCFLAAGGSYLLATGMMASVYAYRSPLHANPPQPGSPVGEAMTRRVVFVLIDALRLDTALDPKVMPYLAELRQAGAWAEMHSREPSYSATGYSVIFTGAWPELSDGPVFNLETEDIPAWTQDNLFSAAQRHGLQTAVSGYEWFGKLIPAEAVTSSFYTPGEDQAADREVVDAALPWIEMGEHQLILIHLDQVDYAGHHEGGPQDQNWDAAARRVDDLLREIASRLDLSQDTLFVCSDHGQVDAGGHGGDELDAVREPFLLVGAGIHPGEYEPVEMVDIAPTLAVLLGINLPASTQGQARGVMLALSAEKVLALETAQTEQQTRLAAAYQDALGKPVELGGRGRIVEQTQRAMQGARQALVNGARLPRFLLAGILALIPLGFLVWKRTRISPWLLAGAALYLLIYNLRYAIIDGNGYTFSYVIGATELVIYAVITALLAFGVGWLAASLGAHSFSQGKRRAAEFTFSLVMLILYVLSLPLLWSYAMDGLMVGRTLPDFGRSFLALFAMVQGLAVGVWGGVFAGIAVLVAAIRGRKR